MKILALIPSYPHAEFNSNIGGGEISNRLLLEGLTEKGHEVTVLTLSGGSLHEKKMSGTRIEEPRGCNFHKALDWVIKRLFYANNARKLILESKPDVIIATTDLVAFGVKLGKYYQIPVVVFIRSYENFEVPQTAAPSRYPKFKKLVKRIILGDNSEKALGGANLLLVNSKFMDGFCREKVPGIPTCIIYPPLDLDLAELRIPNGLPTVSMVGTSPKKGASLVRAIAKQLPCVNFRIIGCPNLEQGYSLNEDNLMHVGWCDTHTEFRERADIVLVPSRWDEPFGRVAIEALAAGAIPLVSDRGGLSETVAYEPALIVPSSDVSPWVARVSDVIGNSEKYLAAATTARVSLSRFTLSAQVANLESVLEELAVKHKFI